MYTLEWSERSRKDLRKLNASLIKRITEKAESIKSVPYHFLERYKNSDLWKLRVGDYRAFIEIDEKNKVLKIFHIENRKKAYKGKWV